MFRNVPLPRSCVHHQKAIESIMSDDFHSPMPFTSKAADIEDSWIDYNGHLNMAYYLVMFEKAFDDFHYAFGVTEDYVKTRNMTTYTGQTKIDYLREVHKGTKLTATCQILNYDQKRIHTWQELQFEDGTVAATCETLTLHIDASGPKVAPFPADILNNIKTMADKHLRLQRPAKAGQPIAIRSKENTAS